MKKEVFKNMVGAHLRVRQMATHVRPMTTHERPMLITMMFISMFIFTGCPIEPDDPDNPDDDLYWQADIQSFTFSGIEGSATLNSGSATITAKAKETVDLKTIVPTFDVSKNAVITFNSKTLVSGQTVVDFSQPVTFIVTSEDKKTTKNWVVTITGGNSDLMAQIPYFNYIADNPKPLFDYMAPGIYIYDDKMLFAKGTDGSWFHVSDLHNLNFADGAAKFWPRSFTMGDGDKREAFIDAVKWPTSPVYYYRLMDVYPNSGDVFTNKKGAMRTQSFLIYAANYPMAFNCSVWLNMYKTSGYGEWQKLDGGNVCGVPTTLYRFTFPGTGVKFDYHVAANNICMKAPVDDKVTQVTYVDTQAGDMNYMLRKIAKIIGTECESTIVNFDDMWTKAKYIGNRWMSEWYPASFENGMFPKYTGALTISTFTVSRDYDEILPDHIGWMEVTGTSNYAAAKAHIALLRSKITLTDSEFNEDDQSKDWVSWTGYQDNCELHSHPGFSYSLNYEWKVNYYQGHLVVSLQVIILYHDGEGHN